MKAVLENIETIKGSSAFVSYTFEVPYFEFKWHYHPEYELTLITRGSGKRIVGDSHEPFNTGDLVLLGPGLPHTWYSEPEQHELVSAVVIQFHESLISTLTASEEGHGLSVLLSSANRGLRINHDKNPSVARRIRKLSTMTGLARISALLDILHLLSAEAHVPLSSEFYAPSKNKAAESRINKICRYVQQHSAGTVSVDEAAAMVHLSKSAFCKFFKRIMKVTFSDYLNEIRIASACNLLLETDCPVHDIAALTGFESLTYFNRVFQRKKNMTPSSYRVYSKRHTT